MNKPYTLKLVLIFTLVAGISISAYSQQLPTRTPYFKSKNKTVAALPLTSFAVDTVTAANLVTMLLGPGASISNLTYTGAGSALGAFTDNNSSIGIDTGIVISTGNVLDIPGPNVSASTTTVYNTPGDSVLSSLTLFPTYDAAIIDFDILVTTDTLMCNFVFGSEEYPEFAPSNFNDIFAFFVSGPGISGMKNIATLPGTDTIISINNVNQSINSQYYIDNDSGLNVEYDGYTVPFTIYHPIQNGQTYHFRIAVADCADQNFDSGVFIKKGSVLGYACMPVPGFNPVINGLSCNFINTTNYAQYYTWDYGDGITDTTTQNYTSHTYAAAGNYMVTLKAYNYYQVATYTQSLSIGNVGITEPLNAKTGTKLQTDYSGHYTIRLGLNANAEVRVYSITGELMQYFANQGATEIKVDVNTLPRGIYILQLNTAEQTQNWKIVR